MVINKTKELYIVLKWKRDKLLIFIMTMELMEKSMLWIRTVPSGSGSGSGQEIKIFRSEVRQPILNHAETDPDYQGKPTNFFLKGILA